MRMQTHVFIHNDIFNYQNEYKLIITIASYEQKPMSIKSYVSKPTKHFSNLESTDALL